MSEYLPSDSSNQIDSGGRGHGQKMRLACRLFDYTYRVDALSFATSVDADRSVFGLLPAIHLRNAHSPLALAKTAHQVALNDGGRSGESVSRESK
jgi:hypothetical protein